MQRETSPTEKNKKKAPSNSLKQLLYWWIKPVTEKWRKWWSRKVKAKSAIPTGQKHYFLFLHSVPKSNVNALMFVLIQRKEASEITKVLQGDKTLFPHAVIRKRCCIYKCCQRQMYQAGSQRYRGQSGCSLRKGITVLHEVSVTLTIMFPFKRGNKAFLETSLLAYMKKRYLA